MSHAPEVLADLVSRLRRERPPVEARPTSSGRVYFIPREEIGAAYAARVLDVDRAATALLCSDLDVVDEGQQP